MVDYGIFEGHGKKKAALVFSGGALRGFSQFGAYKVIYDYLEKNGYYISKVAGTSFGSITACLVSLGYTPDEICEFARRSDFRLSNIADLKLGDMGLLKGDKLKNDLMVSVGDRFLSDSRCDIALTTVDIKTGDEFIFTREGLFSSTGSLSFVEDIKMIDAIRASSAIPGLFMPIKKYGKILVDGGLVSALPLHTVDMESYDLVIAVDVCMGNFNFITDEKPNKIQMIQQSISILQRQFVFEKIEKRLNEHKNLILVKPDVGPVKPGRRSELERVIRLGQESAKKILG